MCARLLSISLGPGMDESDALAKVCGAIQEKLESLACRELPKLEFFGELQRGYEFGDQPIWKIKSKPAAWVAELRQEIRAFAENLGFKVDGLLEAETEVHIPIRGRYATIGSEPQHPSDRSDFCMTFHKLGFRRRYEYGMGRPEQFGGTISVNFGTGDYVVSGGPTQVQLSSIIPNDVNFPAPSAGPPVSTRRSRKPPSASNRSDERVGAKSARVELHESTNILDLKSAEDVAAAASLCDSDQAAAQINARVCGEVAQNRFAFTQPFVLLKVSRDPAGYHEQLDHCAELQECRDILAAAGKAFKLPSGARVFVDPVQYEAAKKAAELKGGLTPQNVLVSQHYEDLVVMVIKRIPCNSKVRVQCNAKIPSGVVSEAISSGIDLEISRSFIHVPVPSSLRSSANGQTPTASTTEAHGGKNPRRA